MRISDTNSSSKVSSTKKKGIGKPSGSGLFSLDQAGGAEAASAPDAPQNISNIQSVISLDSLDILSRSGDEKYIKKQNIDWGHDIIKNLESIKYQILNGKISHSTLLTLTERLNNIPINSSDEQLKNIVSEIEIRAAVEIEKLKKITNLT